MQIRKMIAGDIPSLARLYEQFWGDHSSIKKMSEVFARIERNPDYILLSATIDDTVAGSIYAVVCHELYGECRPFMVVENFIVDRDHRRKGIGRALIGEVEKIASDRGCSQIILITENSREDTIRFYASVGYDPDTHKGFKKPLTVKSP